jgi:hypothetical protein
MTRLADQSSEALLDQFHHANEQLHDARLDWEHSLEATEFRHQERVDAAWQKLQQIEQEVEDLEQRIKTSFARAPLDLHA